MHDCALGKEGGPSAPRVEHRFFASEGINGKNHGGKGYNYQGLYRILPL